MAFPIKCFNQRCQLKLHGHLKILRTDSLQPCTALDVSDARFACLNVEAQQASKIIFEVQGHISVLHFPYMPNPKRSMQHKQYFSYSNQ